MRIGIVEKDLLCLGLSSGYNCMGVMGSGVARVVRNKWPEVYDEYARAVKTLEPNCLGGCLLVPVENNTKAIANLFGQYYYRGGVLFLP